MKNSTRYSEGAKEEKLFYELAPHYKELQKTVATTLQKYFAERKDKEINILELGCGSGITSQQILSKNPEAILVAIDNDQGALEQASSRLKSYENERRLKLVNVDINEYLKLQPNGFFDAVVSALTLHNCDALYREITYKEILRTLKTGGVFINADKYVQDDKTEHQQALAWQLAQFEVFRDYGRPDLQEKWVSHYKQDEAPNLLLKENEFVRELSSLGFQKIMKIFREKMEAIYVAEK